MNPAQSSSPEKSVPPELVGLDDAVLAFHSDDLDAKTKPAPRERPSGECCKDELEAQFDVELFTEITFKGERRGYYINASGLTLELHQHVIVEAEKGHDLGMVSATGEQARMKSRLRTRPCTDPLKKVVRLAEEADIKVRNYHREQENTAFDICLDKIHKLNMQMKLVDVEFQFDRNRITFYFTADGRVDFRELVRELASEYRTRIELRQIGPRDEAKRLGGFGVCGREICCNTWLGAFEPISTEMARIQNLSLNPSKLTGQCGRLKCCLSYEITLYEELLKKFPPLDYTVKTSKGSGKIEKIDIFQDAIFVHYPNNDSWDRMTLDEVNAIVAKSKK